MDIQTANYRMQPQDAMVSVQHTANGDQGLDAGDHAASEGSKARRHRVLLEVTNEITVAPGPVR
jgi:hypothetical protein